MFQRQFSQYGYISQTSQINDRADTSIVNFRRIREHKCYENEGISVSVYKGDIIISVINILSMNYE